MSSSTIFPCFIGPISPNDPRQQSYYNPRVCTVRCGSSHSAQIPKEEGVEEHYYSRNSRHFWDRFYKRHKNKFFKDRHYLEKDWGKYFCDSNDASGAESSIRKVVLEVGCGTGNTLFPLVAAYPNVFVHACDFSSEAVRLVKLHSGFKDERIDVFVCDIAKDDLCNWIRPSSVDVVTMIFMLSAVSPNKMPQVLQNLKTILKPNGHILLRDYALGDSAQVKLQRRNQIIDENFCFRGDEDFLTSLFVGAGFKIVDINTYCRQIENRSKNVTMSRHWVRAVFNHV
ncbi:OLC1v1015086C2 [Oldenlandia corymbosa var. corymbosa]|uniref:tRNA N(3)-methylcytidine methyltransferase n=1 Tax=Oldenlandia corymbosa var. corymbosa TaxID=529605 RepID=A0AAV1E2N8_OLDCO|nr:OLC1v1015086C2 [Oldenlandia corymbosa var. corymbosa]